MADRLSAREKSELSFLRDDEKGRRAQIQAFDASDTRIATRKGVGF